MNNLERRRQNAHNRAVAALERLRNLEHQKSNKEVNLYSASTGWFKKTLLRRQIANLSKKITAANAEYKRLNAEGMNIKKLINNARRANQTR